MSLICYSLDTSVKLFMTNLVLLSTSAPTRIISSYLLSHDVLLLLNTSKIQLPYPITASQTLFYAADETIDIYIST